MIVATGVVIAGGGVGMLANTSASVVPEVGKVVALAAATAASSKRGT
jgi:aspartate oxidase